MSALGRKSIEHTVQLTHKWMNDLDARLGWDDKQPACFGPCCRHYAIGCPSTRQRAPARSCRSSSEESITSTGGPLRQR